MLSYSRLGDFTPSDEVMHIHIGHVSNPGTKSIISALALPYSFLINRNNYSLPEVKKAIGTYYDSLFSNYAGELCAVMILMLSQSAEVHLTMDDEAIELGVLDYIYEKLLSMNTKYDKLVKKHYSSLMNIVSNR